MKHKQLLLFFCFLPLPSFSQKNQPNSSPSCPLDFSLLQKFIFAAVANPPWIPTDTPSRCSYALRYLHLAEAQYLHTESHFFLPSNSSPANACLTSLSSFLSPLFPYSFSLTNDCGFQYQNSCTNITSRADFESRIPPPAIADIYRNCRPSLDDSRNACSACTSSLARASSYLATGPDPGNVTTCSDYPYIYAAAAVNLFGSADEATASCLFSLSTEYDRHADDKNSSYTWLYALASVFTILSGVAVAWFLVARRRRRRGGEKKIKVKKQYSKMLFSMEDIRAATDNFSRDNIIGRGGYGYVYRGFLNGSEVALKRIKNCSPGGEAVFEHEVEVISSVKHVNLVALRGYCSATTPMEGHQRIIVCELMRNGSLYEHLFDGGRERLSWPVRARIAVGTARGLAYLHYGAQPAIIHRDVKGANILLDESFEPKLADFGLARFAPEGMTHVSTRAAGTLGYVAPEYALYGQLTEKSDVYSFGVVMLELLSGRKALMSSVENGMNVLVRDWAWSLVREGRVLDVIEEGMEDLAGKEVMEEYVLLAVLCCHPLMHARPTMDQVVKILETNINVNVSSSNMPYDQSISVSGMEVGVPIHESDCGSNKIEDDAANFC